MLRTSIETAGRKNKITFSACRSRRWDAWCAHNGVVPRTDNLDPDFSVAENPHVYGRHFGIAAAALDARILEMLV
jgi:ABC-type multidrug transport system ATPase subunit